MVKAMDKALKENKGYDIGLLLKILVWPTYNKVKYICSEFVQMALYAVRRIYYPRIHFPDKSRGDIHTNILLCDDNLERQALTPKDLARILPGEMRKL